MREFVIRDAKIGDLKGYHSCLGSIAAERKYIASVKAPPLAASRKWMRSVLAAKYPFIVATQYSKIVGFCDVGPNEREGFQHTAGLGMGLCAPVRGRRLGSRLLKKAIARSRKRGIEKLELRVYASNRIARRLYEKFGFATEGRQVRARKLDGRYDDIILMGLFLTAGKAVKRTRRKRRL